MSLNQIAIYSGFGKKKLIGLARSGAIRGRQIDGRGAWSFDKLSFDEYWHQPFQDTKAEAHKFLDKIKRRA